jgi:hypothetical protein
MSGGLRIRTRITVQIGGYSLSFRPLTVQEAVDVVEDVDRDPSNSLEISIEACRGACVSGPFDEVAEEYPLAFADQILPRILQQCSEAAQQRVSKGVRMWKAADRNYGRTAESLLAFKAYTGGDYSEAQFAGALAVAELIGTTKGIFHLMTSYLKAMKRG